MARVFVSFFSGTGSEHIPCFYEGLLASLKEQGHDVRYVISNDFLARPWNSENKYASCIKVKKLQDDLRLFNPEIAFVYNNSTLPKLTEVIECPICVMEADTYIYYNSPDEIRHNPEQYHFFASSPASLENIPSYFKVPKDRVHDLDFATGIYAEDIHQDKNISFIGSNFAVSNSLYEKFSALSIEEKKIFLNIYHDYETSPFYDFKTLIKKYGNPDFAKRFQALDFLDIISNSRRVQILQNLSDFGLHLYGKGWDDPQKTPMALIRRFDSQPIYSLRHNQDIYNSSKICINISHAQAQNMFPWRVMDILASNGCLVSPKSNRLDQFLQGYIDLPTYTNNYEAMVLCRRLLDDESYRRDIVDACQQAITDKGRWHHRFKEVEEIIGIPLLSESHQLDQSKVSQPTRIASAIYKRKPLIPLEVYLLLANFVPKRLHIWGYRFLSMVGIEIDYDTAKRIKDKRFNPLLHLYSALWKRAE